MSDKTLRINDSLKIDLKNMVFRVQGADTGDFISCDEAKCNGCGQCALVCSASLWTVSKANKARLAPRYKELCLECAACYAACQQDAILFRYPNGGSGVIIRHG